MTISPDSAAKLEALRRAVEHVTKESSTDEMQLRAVRFALEMQRKHAIDVPCAET